MPTMISDVKYLSCAEAAEILGVSEVRVRQFCRNGRLGERFHTVWMIREDELHEFARKERMPGRPKYEH